MIYSNTDMADALDLAIQLSRKVNEAQRIEIERMQNVMRLISYNNRRIARGLEPLDYPPALTKNPPAIHVAPIHRDIIELSKR